MALTQLILPLSAFFSIIICKVKMIIIATSQDYYKNTLILLFNHEDQIIIIMYFYYINVCWHQENLQHSLLLVYLLLNLSQDEGDMVVLVWESLGPEKNSTLCKSSAGFYVLESF